MHEKYVGLKKSYSEQEMVGIKNVLPLFCVTNCELRGLDLVISTGRAPNLKKLT